MTLSVNCSTPLYHAARAIDCAHQHTVYPCDAYSCFNRLKALISAAFGCFAFYAYAVGFRQLKDLHLDLFGRVQASNPSLELVMQLFDEYYELTNQLDSHPELKHNMQLQALNTRVLDALTSKSFQAFMVAASAMNA